MTEFFAVRISFEKKKKNQKVEQKVWPKIDYKLAIPD